ncbi:MAG TPA: hypothetical protein PL052_01670 [Synergistales bacterium]|nr:hypothetical protein [Synergistales bacterium]HPC75873.1 hypothetical protein [Synergistales bacterium]HRS48568.1 hypothetical protein [Thermovirgaceae bacterium]HRU90842.1 hypothetical protein [Thermovirgaceae bacterium]
MKRTIFILFLAALVMLPAPPDRAEAARSYEELAEAYSRKFETRPKAEALRSTLLEGAWDSGGPTLLGSIKDPGLSPEQRAANGLKLVEELFPGGDPARWDKVSGFWPGPMIPKPLAAFDAVFFTVIALLELDRPEAPWMAQDLLQALRGSSAAALLALRTAPEEYLRIVEALEKGTGLPPLGGWPRGKIRGRLPFAHPVRSVITETHAQSRDMQFLNSAGQPASAGPYAWDRDRGRVYRVVEPSDYHLWWLLRN